MTIEDRDIELTYHEKSDQVNLEILQKAFKVLRQDLISEFANFTNTINAADNIYYIVLSDGVDLWKVGITDSGALKAEPTSRGPAQTLYLESPDGNIWDITIDSSGRLSFEDTGSTLADPLYLASSNNVSYLIACANDGRITSTLQD